MRAVQPRRSPFFEPPFPASGIDRNFVSLSSFDAMMRLVSLCPAATEWIACFGAAEELVGRSHLCDYPDGIRHLPVLTREHPVGTEPSGGPAELDVAALRALRPDLVVVRDVRWEEAVRDAGGGAPEVFRMEAGSMKAVLGAALALGKRIGRLEAAMAAIGARERRLTALRTHLGLHRRVDPDTLPSVVFVTGAAPGFTPGGWVPDLVEMAGGRLIGTPLRSLSGSADFAWLQEADPDVICIAGDASSEEAGEPGSSLTMQPAWAMLRAVRANRVYVLDGRSLVHRPGPRLYRAVELLASAFYPDQACGLGLSVAPWEMRTIDARRRAAAAEEGMRSSL